MACWRVSRSLSMVPSGGYQAIRPQQCYGLAARRAMQTEIERQGDKVLIIVNAPEFVDDGASPVRREPGKLRIIA